MAAQAEGGQELALKRIYDAKAQMVLCRGAMDPDNAKAPMAGAKWGDKHPTATEAYAHLKRGGYIGVAPYSLGMAVVDVDKNTDKRSLDEIRQALDRQVNSPAVVAYPSNTKGRYHLWYACRKSTGKKWEWQEHGLGGEVRCCDGSNNGTYAVVWELEQLAEVLPVDRDAFPQARLSDLPKARKTSTERKSDSRHKAIRDDDWTEHNRNNTLYRLAVSSAKRGTYDDDKTLLREKAITAGLPADEVDKTMASAFNAGSEARTKVSDHADHRGLALALDRLDYDYRLNERAARVEMKNVEGGWFKPKSQQEAHMRSRIADTVETWDRNGEAVPLRFKAASWDEYLGALSWPKRCDPFLLWVDGLPEWDGVERLDGLLPSLWDGCSINDPLTRWAGAAPLLGAIRRARQPGTPLKAMLVLIGAQGIGKSPFISHLFPASDRGTWFSDSLSFSDTPVRQIESLLGRVIVEAGELTGVRRADLSGLKAFLSRLDDGGTRLAYDARPDDMPRRFVLIGSANNDGSGVLPTDESGYTRFAPVHLGEAWGAIEPAMDTMRPMLWAEARHRERNGEDGSLPRELHAASEKAARGVRVRPAWEYAVDAIDPATQTHQVGGEWKTYRDGVSLADLCKQAPAIGRGHPGQVTRYMESEGWERGTGRGRRLWLAPEASAEAASSR